MITSLSNKRVKEIILLNQKARERQKQGAFVAEGVKLFLEAPLSQIRQIYLSEEFDTEANLEVRDKLEKASVLAKTGAVFMDTVDAAVFRKMCDTQTPQGIICVVAQRKYKPEDMIRGEGLYLLLENIQDPGNLGTMFRTGEGAGVDGIFMSKETVDIYNPKTIRSTMGSVFRVPFCYVESLTDTIEMLQAKGVMVFAAHLKGEKLYHQLSFLGGSAFLIGNEGNGLTKKCADKADAYLKIPMEGKLESLNAAVSAAILMYEAKRQRTKDECTDRRCPSI